jgi:hypothetical protein
MHSFRASWRLPTIRLQCLLGRVVKVQLVPLVAVLMAAALYLWVDLDRGWIPHDEGTLGQSALRVLMGDVPHRDFDEIYTGGLSYLNAGAFYALGANLYSLRMVLFVFYLAWVIALHYSASRFVSHWAAVPIVGLCVVWSVPNYPAAVPSWYNLFFTVFALAAGLRFLETNNGLWLFVAGLCLGISTLFKIIGLYPLVGMLLWLTVNEQSSQTAEATKQQLSPYSVLVIAFSLGTILLVHATVARRLDLPEFVQFVLPASALAVLVMSNELRLRKRSSRQRGARAYQLFFPLLAGAAFPLLAFVFSYAAQGGLRHLIHGVVTLPAERLTFAVVAPPDLGTALLSFPLVSGVVLETVLKSRGRLYLYALAVAGLSLVLATSAEPASYKLVWDSLRYSLPIVVLLGIGAFITNSQDGPRRERLMLVLCVSALFAVVQFPFSAPIYFCYVFPLVVLATTAVLTTHRARPMGIAACALAFYLAFGLLRLNTGTLYGLGYRFEEPPLYQPLDIIGAGLRVPSFEKAEYEWVVSELRAHAQGSYTYATPDAPEVYFLSGLRNPTRTIFDFFDDQTRRTDNILSRLADSGVTAIVLNSDADFSGPVPPKLLERLEARFPHAKTMGKFTVRWR